MRSAANLKKFELAAKLTFPELQTEPKLGRFYSGDFELVYTDQTNMDYRQVI